QAVMQQNLQHIATCGNAGHLYGPAFSGPRSGNCPSALTLQSSGGVTIAGGATIFGDSSFTNSLTIGGALEVMANTTLGGTLSVDGHLSASQIRIGTSVFGPPLVCASNQALRWTGTAWQCVNMGGDIPCNRAGSYYVANSCNAWGPRIVCSGGRV